MTLRLRGPDILTAMENVTPLSRRSIVTAGAWSIPVIAAAVGAPAAAASETAMAPHGLVIVTGGLGATGQDLWLRDGKFNNNHTNTSPSNTIVVNLRLRVRDAEGNPVPNASVFVSGDDVTDSEGNYMVGISPPDTTGNIIESNTKRTATVTSDGNGEIVVKVSTATYNRQDCGFIERTGTITATATVLGHPSVTSVFSYGVFDGAPVVNCS